MQLTDRRAKPAVYFGGKFRIIDFALSNCVNSGIRRIGVATSRFRSFRVRALGQVAAGHVDVEDSHVRLEVTLPWLLQRFAEVAQAAIQKSGQLLLTKR